MAQLQKQKGKKGKKKKDGGESSKQAAEAAEAAEATPPPEQTPDVETPAEEKKEAEEEEGEKPKEAQDEAEETPEAPKEESPKEEPAKEDEEAVAEPEEQQDKSENASESNETVPVSRSHGRQPSISVQSNMRSSSFRQSTGLQPGVRSPPLPPLSPDGSTAPEVFRKQALRLEELERDNKRLEKELDTASTKWKRSEEQLDDLREASGETVELRERLEKAEKQAEEVEGLVSCIAIDCRHAICCDPNTLTGIAGRNLKSRRCNGRTHIFKAPGHTDRRIVWLSHLARILHPLHSRANWTRNPLRLKAWNLKYRIYELN